MNYHVETYPLVYKKAVETFGIEPQRKTAIEEMAELAQQAIEILGEETVKLALEPLGI